MHTRALSSSSAGAGAFATTIGSAVLSARTEDPPLADGAISAFCEAYWLPLYAYVRRRGYDPTTAKDLTQEFFAELFRKHLLAEVDPARGKFQSWLLGVMNHFLAREWTKARAQKRGGGQPVFSWDELKAEERYLVEPAENSSPEREFDRRWAFTVLERVLARLCDEYTQHGQSAHFSILKQFVSWEIPEVSYEQAARQLNMTTSAIRSAIYRLRQRFQGLLRVEIAQTVGRPAQVDEELRYLLAVIRSR